MYACERLVRLACCRARSTYTSRFQAFKAVQAAAHSVYLFYIIDSKLALSVLWIYDEIDLLGKIRPLHEITTGNESTTLQQP